MLGNCFLKIQYLWCIEKPTVRTGYTIIPNVYFFSTWQSCFRDRVSAEEVQLTVTRNDKPCE